MKKIICCLAITFAFALFAQAQKVKTMTGTVVREGHGGRWSFLVIRAGNKDYGIQTTHEPSYGDEQSGVKPWQIKTVGNVYRAGRKVKVFYTRVDTSFDYDNITSWLKATKIVEVASR